MLKLISRKSEIPPSRLSSPTLRRLVDLVQANSVAEADEVVREAHSEVVEGMAELDRVVVPTGPSLVLALATSPLVRLIGSLPHLLQRRRISEVKKNYHWSGERDGVCVSLGSKPCI